MTDTFASASTALDDTRARPLALRISGLRRGFGDRAVLDGIDLDVESGSFVALLGRSGTGKTTLLRIVAGLDGDAIGEVRAATRRTVVFQEPRLLPWAKVRENVALGLRGGDVDTRTAAALDEVGLANHAGAWPVTLSGGEAQRASLARAMVREPQLLLLDEPFGALDALTRLKMHALLGALLERHQPAVLLVTHDVDEAIVLADRILVLDAGHLVHDVTVDRACKTRSSGEFARLRAQLLSVLGVEDADTTSHALPSQRS